MSSEFYSESSSMKTDNLGNINKTKKYPDRVKRGVKYKF